MSRAIFRKYRYQVTCFFLVPHDSYNIYNSFNLYLTNINVNHYTYLKSPHTYRYYIFGTVVSESPTLGFGAVGLFSALVVFVGALVSIPAASLAKQWGKERVIVASAISFGCVAIPIFLFKNETIGTWFFMSVLMVLYGAGRGVWETINKAVLVDFFAEEGFDKTAAAFSAASFATGYAQGLGFFMFRYVLQCLQCLQSSKRAVCKYSAACLSLRLSAGLQYLDLPLIHPYYYLYHRLTNLT